MLIGILYESSEWSDFKLAAELAARGCDVRMIDLAIGGGDERVDALLAETALSCDLIVSRIFASAVFRGHAVAHGRMARIGAEAERRGIAMANSARSHAFETDKARATRALAQEGIAVPHVQACGLPREIDLAALAYPCIIKPNCGGRTTHTAVARSDARAGAFLADAPEFSFIVEDFIECERGFVTRVELVDGAVALVVKRSVVEGGLSAYRLGSTYALYEGVPDVVRITAEAAGSALGIGFGSFDIIENGGRAYVIDANAVSNVSEDNTATFGGFDLMAAYAEALAGKHPPKAVC